MQAYLEERGIALPRASLHDYGLVLPKAKEEDWAKLWFGGCSHTRPLAVRWTATAVTVPCWSLLLLASVPTAFGWWSGRRFPSGHCPTCGYDLTGNVSGVCPECGTAVDRKADR
jgi:hypothetical protein